MAIVLAALAVWMAYEMYARAQTEELWGHRTLVLLLAGWGLLVLFFYPKNQLLTWATLSGALLGLGFPGWLPLPFLMFIALVPLLFVEYALRDRADKPATFQVFRYSFHTFVVWNILSTAWIANSSIAAGLFTIIANSLLMTIPFVLAHHTRRVMERLGYAPLIAYWLVFEYLHYNWELHFPWLTLGNSFAQLPAFVQWYEYTGVLGGSLWVLLANVLFFEWLQVAHTRRQTLLRLSAWIALPIVFSLYQYFIWQEAEAGIEVVVVQPNYEPHYEESEVEEAEKLAKCLRLAEVQVTETTDYLLLPEATFGYAEVRQMEVYPTFQALREWAQRYPRLHIVSGANVYRELAPDEPATKVTRARPGSSFRYEAYNAAIQLRSNSRQVQLHKKSKLVPGPENFPFRRALFFLTPLLERFGGTTAGLGMEDQPVVFEGETARIAPLICYESVFGAYVSQFVRGGAQAIFIMTNDGWWDRSLGHRQHLYFASLRAIESRRSIARAANTGVSAFINSRGDIVESTAYGEAAAIKARISVHSAPTFYLQWGDMIGRLSLFVAAIFLLNTLVRNILQKEG